MSGDHRSEQRLNVGRPGRNQIEVDLSPFRVPLAARWFDRVRGRHTPRSGPIENKGTQRFVPPANGDWVLLLQRDVASKQAISESGATSNRRYPDYWGPNAPGRAPAKPPPK